MLMAGIESRVGNIYVTHTTGVISPTNVTRICACCASRLLSPYAVPHTPIPPYYTLLPVSAYAVASKRLYPHSKCIHPRIQRIHLPIRHLTAGASPPNTQTPNPKSPHSPQTSKKNTPTSRTTKNKTKRKPTSTSAPATSSVDGPTSNYSPPSPASPPDPSCPPSFGSGRSGGRRSRTRWW